MLITVAVLASLVLVIWLIFRASKGRQIRAHTISYAMATLTGIYSYAYFLSMNLDRLFKVFISILLGVALIILAAYIQRRRQLSSGETK